MYYQQPVQIHGVATMPAGPRAAVQLVNQRVLNQISKPAWQPVKLDANVWQVRPFLSPFQQQINNIYMNLRILS